MPIYHTYSIMQVNILVIRIRIKYSSLTKSRRHSLVLEFPVRR